MRQLLETILQCDPVQAYYAVSGELYAGVDQSGTVRKYLPGWTASADYQDAARSAFFYVENALRELCEELGFDVATGIDSEIGYRAITLIISKSSGTRDSLEFEQFKAGVIKSELRAEEQLRASGYDFS